MADLVEAEQKRSGGEFIGDEEDLLTQHDGPQGDNSVPMPAAWQQFRQLQGWQGEDVLGAQIASVVFKEWEIYLYRLARGLVGGGGL